MYFALMQTPFDEEDVVGLHTVVCGHVGTARKTSSYSV